MTNKNFDVWNAKKKSLEVGVMTGIKFHARDIWWCSYGINLGSEQDGAGGNFERPCVILKKLSPTTAIVLPLSTKKKLEIFQVPVVIGEKEGYVLLDQVRVIDAKRLLRKMGYVQKAVFEIIRIKFKNLL
jgi:mRNA interferase MazF